MVVADAIDYLKKVVSSNLFHKNYTRTVELAEEYYDYYTGELDKRLERIVFREETEEF
jgi:hypothetical protein